MASGWWPDTSAWVKAARDKSAETLEFFKRDLQEFTTTVKDETTHTTEVIKTKLHAGDASNSGLGHLMNTVSSSVSKALYIPPDDLGEQVFTVDGDGGAVYDPLQSRLRTLQRDSSTYVNPPASELHDSYTEFTSTFRLDDMKTEISELLLQNDVRSLYNQLVPVSVSHSDFWTRYFFHEKLLRDKFARRAEMLKKVEQRIEKTDTLDAWEDDWDIVQAENGSANAKSSSERAETASETNAQPKDSVIERDVPEKDTIGAMETSHTDLDQTPTKKSQVAVKELAEESPMDEAKPSTIIQEEPQVTVKEITESPMDEDKASTLSHKEESIEHSDAKNSDKDDIDQDTVKRSLNFLEIRQLSDAAEGASSTVSLVGTETSYDARLQDLDDSESVQSANNQCDMLEVEVSEAEIDDKKRDSTNAELSTPKASLTDIKEVVSEEKCDVVSSETEIANQQNVSVKSEAASKPTVQQSNDNGDSTDSWDDMALDLSAEELAMAEDAARRLQESGITPSLDSDLDMEEWE